ncbi:MAG TPA: hypothetical protein VKU85_02675 [bacterium]|nr:hypothetical protein [bacterium]
MTREPLLPEPLSEELAARIAAEPDRTLPEIAPDAAAARSLRGRAFDLRRGAWQVLCPLDSDSVILDLECDLGATGRSLARNCARVVGRDLNAARRTVARAVNRETGVGNFEVEEAAPDEAWPGGPLRGVLLGPVTLRRAGSARADRVRLLAEARARLGDGGWLCVRLPSGRALGPEGPAASDLPGAGDWPRLLTDAGFDVAEVWLPLPDQGHADTLVPWPGTDPRIALRAYGVRKAWKLALMSLPGLRDRVPRDLLVIGRLGRVHRPPALRDAHGAPLDPRRVYLNRDRGSVWYGGREGERIRDVTIADGAADTLRRLRAVRDAWAGDPEAPAFFRGWELGGREDRPWADRPNVSGLPLSSLGDLTDDHHDAVLRRLRALQRIGPRVDLPVMDLTAVLEHFLDASLRTSPPAGWLERLRRCAVALVARFPGDRVVLQHGDVTPNNVLYHRGHAELIDWDLATPADFPGYDALNLLLYSRCGPDPEPGYWAGLVAACADGAVPEDVAEWLAAACGPADPVPAVARFWLLRAARGTGFGEAWVERHGRPALERAEEWLRP